MNPDARIGPALRYLLVSLALALVAPFAPSWAACTAGTPLANVVEETPSTDFTVNGDGTVTHLKTGRMWTKCAEGLSGAACATGTATLMNWGAALGSAVAANTTNFAGHNDWRLPDIKELVSIIETCGSNRAINTTMFPNTPGPNFWSSSTYAQYSPSAWAVNFTLGSSLGTGKASSYYARLVRGGQFVDSFDSLKTASTVTYNGNGSTGGSVPVGSTSYANGAAVMVLGNTGSLVKTGSTFAGWSTAANGTGASYPGIGDANFTIGAVDVTLFALWSTGGCTLDVDGNGVIDALTDGLMLIRAQFGLTGSAVTAGAVGAGATRATWGQIQPYLNANCATSFAP